MPERAHPPEADQAAGLRRMFGERRPQVVAFVSGQDACGRTPLLVQTAATLARAGQPVVVIDEGGGPENALAAFGMARRHDLLDMLCGRCRPRETLQAAMPGLLVAAASRFAGARDDVVAPATVAAGLREIERDAAFVLIDCASRPGGQVSPLVRAARHVAVVVAANGQAITHAYALVKRLAREQGRDAFQVVVTRSRSPDEAQAVFENLRNTARAHLGVRLDFLAASRVPATDHLADALLSRLPLQALPVAAGAAGTDRSEAARIAVLAGRMAAESVV